MAHGGGRQHRLAHQETAKPPVDEASELRQEIIQLRLQIKRFDGSKQTARKAARTTESTDCFYVGSLYHEGITADGHGDGSDVFIQRNTHA